jgi:hypothetical protein
VTIPDYLSAVDKLYRDGRATEHSYRGDLQRLLTALCKGVQVTNEPRRIACGAPDYILTKKDIPVGYVEAKDVGVDLGSKTLKEQFDRYRGSLENLIITDYLEFRFFRSGEPTTSIRIGEVVGGKVKPLPAEFDKFTALITDFAAWQGQTITSAKKLAAMMAGKARLLADVIAAAVESDEQSQANSDLHEQMEAFKVILIHDISPRSFADLYAQTIAYGMFAARLHDPSLESFSREEAGKLIPKSNPFLRKLFNSISGNDLDERIVWIVDALADIFRATDIAKLLSGFGKGSGREDAFMHFYEDFLAHYDPKLRKSRGVWYTPDAVVRFIVRAVDDILKTEFDLPSGLADASKVKIKRKVVTQGRHGNAKVKEVQVEEEVHRVQVLDPATGTGTFLAEVVRQVYGKFEGQQGMWPQYVEQHLIPRLNGFELLMASYAMAHLKLDLVLRDTGYDMGQPHGTPNAGPKNAEQQRLRVFLTNSLEEAHPDTGTLFASWLSQEANEANAVKRDTPVMVVLGNPPYSVSSSNKGTWIQDLIKVYKAGLNEKKLNLDDDYIKFLRYGQDLIDRTGEGVLAYVCNNSFLDGITHRMMRLSFLKSFDSVYVVNLHGDSNKKEVNPEGGEDKNVFDIRQGVSINIFVKSKVSKKKDARVRYMDLYGARESKYTTLGASSITTCSWKVVEPQAPNFFLVPLDYSLVGDFLIMPSLRALFPVSSTGIESQRDEAAIHMSVEDLRKTVGLFLSLTTEELRSRLGLEKDGRDWTVEGATKDLKGGFVEAVVQLKPFDYRVIPYSGRGKGIVAYPRAELSSHLLEPNVALVSPRLFKEPPSYFVSKHIIGHKVLSAYDKNFGFPLYLYPETSKQTSAVAQGVQPNLDAKLVEQLAKGVGLSYTFKPAALFAHGTGKELTPLDVLDYCYAVLHSPAYRAKYKEFLKSDFPRIPYPTDPKKFRALVELGAKLRQLHLLEWEGIDRYITQYPVGGTNAVTKKMGKGDFTDGKVWVNDTQYFANVPEVAWNFYIGGYQPAQKWLKDRHGRTLTFDDIRHYQRMIVALNETAKVMEEVDGVGVV